MQYFVELLAACIAGDVVNEGCDSDLHPVVLFPWCRRFKFRQQSSSLLKLGDRTLDSWIVGAEKSDGGPKVTGKQPFASFHVVVPIVVVERDDRSSGPLFCEVFVFSHEQLCGFQRLSDADEEEGDQEGTMPPPRQQKRAGRPKGTAKKEASSGDKSQS